MIGQAGKDKEIMAFGKKLIEMLKLGFDEQNNFTDVERKLS